MWRKSENITHPCLRTMIRLPSSRVFKQHRQLYAVHKGLIKVSSLWSGILSWQRNLKMSVYRTMKGRWVDSPFLALQGYAVSKQYQRWYNVHDSCRMTGFFRNKKREFNAYNDDMKLRWIILLARQRFYCLEALLLRLQCSRRPEQTSIRIGLDSWEKVPRYQYTEQWMEGKTT